MKQLGLVVLGLMITATAVSGILAERMKVVTVCKDVRVGMDGGIGAAIESGGLNPHLSISLFLEHYKGHRKLKTLEVKPSSFEADGGEVFTAPESPDFKFVIAKDKSANGRFPANLDATVEGKQITVRLACTK